MYRRYRRLRTCERCKDKVEILGLYDGKHVCGYCEVQLIERKKRGTLF